MLVANHKTLGLRLYRFGSFMFQVWNSEHVLAADLFGIRTEGGIYIRIGRRLFSFYRAAA